MGEGRAFKNPDEPEILHEKDAGLDIAVWRGFSDKRGPQLIGFGQCKTGTTWQESIARLRPSAFCNDWMEECPLAAPVKLFFIADTITSKWNRITRDVIFFDRCRVIEFSAHISESVLRRCRQWTEAVFKREELKW
jgi:hypothetical protein